MDKTLVIQGLIILLAGSKSLGCSPTKRLLDYTDYIQSVYPTCAGVCELNKLAYDADGKCKDLCLDKCWDLCAKLVLRSYHQAGEENCVTTTYFAP
ncbi:hypothetical protein CSKR_200082 [Clonorchis sinensis]|uniref:Uncharacterized protein n=1 Tax=Clonorchis sinensis TaxID=79923 RepID=A0A8T1LYC3_CLOSI|nr:hypothetical protein CSKR_200082 [Clonorchis sinensis]